jgi:hypothetical protein
MGHRHRLSGGVACAALALAPGCHGASNDEAGGAIARATASASASAAVPVDQLAPGELIEGPERALGLPLPRGTVIETRSPQMVLAYCEGVGASIDAFMKARAPGARGVSTPGVLTLLSFPSPVDKARMLEVTIRRVPREKASRIEVIFRTTKRAFAKLESIARGSSSIRFTCSSRSI